MDRTINVPDFEFEKLSIGKLTKAIASGNTEAFTFFYRSRFDSMYGEARRVTGRDEAFCLDVVQDAMLRVIRSMRRKSSEEHLRAWLRVVVHTCAYDRLRKELRRRRWEQTAASLPIADPAPTDTHEKMAWVQRELSRADDPETRLLVMRYKLDWTLRRIGETLGLGPGAVDGRIGRAVTGMRRRAEETFHE